MYKRFFTIKNIPSVIYGEHWIHTDEEIAELERFERGFFENLRKTIY